MGVLEVGVLEVGTTTRRLAWLSGARVPSVYGAVALKGESLCLSLRILPHGLQYDMLLLLEAQQSYFCHANALMTPPVELLSNRIRFDVRKFDRSSSHLS
jgi:hypothetical protein